ncbi:MAG TPA: glycosyltransferase family 39 protein [Candidatus Saccharimonadales bacterium]|nr:glycosyltransferase family 39 protein [Candidatus Saccharimonadales bacterium]
MAKQMTDYLLYRQRYLIGYTLIGLTVIGLLITAGLFIPGGLSQTEMNSVVTGHAVSLSLADFRPEWIIDLPYHLLQRASIALFGVNNFGIKFPSLLLGALSVFGVFLLLRLWFRRNVAVLTAIIVITTGQFLFVAQNGTPSIVYIFWSVWLLVCAMMISRRAKHTIYWKMALFAIAALSLYTPLSPYILLALASAIVLHPHLRYLIRRLSKVKIAVGFFVALILITPLAYAIIRQPSIGLTLLGIPSEQPDLKENILQLLRQYLDFVSPSSGIIMTPIYSLGTVILIALGVIQLVTTKYTARSYVITAWIVLLAPVLLINPGYVSITFVPVMLLIAMGISMLLTNWYRLFPRNPYARFAGLLPLTILIAGLVLSGVGRYMYGYMYDPRIAGNFTHDLQMLNDQLAAPDRGTTTILTSPSELPFYSIVAGRDSDVTATADASEAHKSGAQTLIVTHAAHKTGDTAQPYRIVTDNISKDADRLYIYKTAVK